VIEQGIYFALGCIVTALLALMFAPVFWQRALRLTRQRLQLQVPLSMQEILAERDQLRAEFAVERLRVEQAMERVLAAKAGDMAEIGRRSNEVATAAGEIAVLRAVQTTQAETIGRLTREVTETEAETAALRVALHDGETKLDEWRRRAEAAQAHQQRLLEEADGQRATISSLKTLVMSLEIRLDDAERALAAEKDAAAAIRVRLETAMVHAARHENAGISLRRELDEAKTHRRQLDEDLTAARAALREGKREHDATIESARSRQLEQDNAAAVLRLSLDRATARVFALENELKGAHESLADARRARDAAANLHAEQKAAASFLRRELDVARAHNRQLSEQLATAQTTPRRDGKAKRSAGTIGGGQEPDRALPERAADDAEAQIRELEEALNIAQTSLPDRDQASRAQDKPANDEEFGAARLPRDVEAADARRLELEDELSAARADARRAADLDRAAQLEATHAAAAEALRADVDVAQTRIQALALEVETAHIAREAADAAREAADAAREAADAARETAERERERDDQLHINLRSEHEGILALLRRDLETTRGNTQDLERRLTAAQNAIGEEREKAAQRVRDLQAEQKMTGDTLRRELDDAKTRLRRREDELTVAQTALANAREREKASHLQRSLQAEKAKREERLHADHLALVAKENLALKDALASARRESESTPRADVSDTDAGLRASIHALGLAVATLTQQSSESPESEGVARRVGKDDASQPIRMV
jgi:hypothetical protein